MKFARYLEENTVPEWKRVYIQYRGLKKLIKRVAEHRAARLGNEQQQQQRDGSGSRSSAEAVAGGGSGRTGELRRRTAGNQSSERQDRRAETTYHPGSSLARSGGSRWRSDYGGTRQGSVEPSEEEGRATIPPVSLKGTGLRLAGDPPEVVQEGVLSGSDDGRDLEAQVDRRASAEAEVETRMAGRQATSSALSDDAGSASVTVVGSNEDGCKKVEEERGAVERVRPSLRTRRRLSQGLRSETLDASASASAPAATEGNGSGSGTNKNNDTTDNSNDNDNDKNNNAQGNNAARWNGKPSFKLKKVKDQPRSTLDELMAHEFDDEENKLFSACDAELEKITSFYAARELDAAHKYVQLTRQLQELAEHRRQYRARHKIDNAERTHVDRAITAMARERLSRVFAGAPLTKEPGGKAEEAEVGPKDRKGASRSVGKDGAPLDDDEDVEAADKSRSGSHDEEGDRKSYNGLAAGLEGSGKADTAEDAAAAKATETQDEGDRRRAAALAQMQNSLRGWDDETDRAIREQNKAAALSRNPEAYYAARKKLKTAVLEYYKYLETLTNYKILNRTGFAKIMKKFSKTVGVPCTDAYYEARVAPSVLVTSNRIEGLLKSTEEIFAAYFEHGNRKAALNRLRVREDSTTHHFSVFRSGLYLGVALCATVAGLVEAMRPEVQAKIPQWEGVLRVFGAEWIPTAFALLFGLNLAGWHHARINTVFIFEFDARSTIDHRQFIEIPALLMLLLSLCFWVAFLDPFPDAIAPTTWPTVWLVILVVVLLNPLPMLHRASRRWFVVSVLRVFSGGLKRVEFRDFFLGDELNSIAWSLSNLWYFGCEWHHSWAAPDRCAPNGTYWTAVLLSVPALLRLGQCVRRWIDSGRRTHLHLVNGGKYASAVVNNFVYIHFRRAGSPFHSGAMAGWMVCAAVYSLWHVGWDLTMDWSLLRPHARHLLLRDELSFHPLVYYAFIAVDVVVRCNWCIYLFPGRASVTLRSFLAALVEMLRRVCWNLIRVENEQMGNTDSFKILRDLPLPYHQREVRRGPGGRGMDDDEDDDDEGGGGAKVHAGGIFGSRRLVELVVAGRKKGDAVSPSQSRVEVERWVSDADEEGEQQRRGRERGRRGPEDDARRRKGLRRERVVALLRDKLVPDGGGDEGGERLDQRAATKGRTGRDYVPRRGEVEESGSESEGESEEGMGTGRGTEHERQDEGQRSKRDR